MIGQPQAALAELLADVDAALMLPGPTPANTVYAAMQDVLRGNRGRTVHFHWLGAYKLDGTLKDIDEMVDDFYVRVLSDTDYDALGAAQRAFEVDSQGSYHCKRCGLPLQSCYLTYSHIARGRADCASAALPIIGSHTAAAWRQLNI